MDVYPHNHRQCAKFQKDLIIKIVKDLETDLMVQCGFFIIPYNVLVDKWSQHGLVDEWSQHGLVDKWS